MKERPIIFNAEQVRAVLDGRKTQHRIPLNWRRTRAQEIAERDDGSQWPWSEDCEKGGDYWWDCPFGEAGSKLWVRESYRMPESLDRYSPKQVADLAIESGYRKPWAPIQLEADGVRTGKWIGFNTPPMVTEPGKLRPSIHMPRWASRITLEITGVRVERLHEITIGDICKEGLAKSMYEFRPVTQAFPSFEGYWESIHGTESWKSNPWVWVIEFKRVENTND